MRAERPDFIIIDLMTTSIESGLAYSRAAKDD
jgi:hypothetical protein